MRLLLRSLYLLLSWPSDIGKRSADSCNRTFRTISPAVCRRRPEATIRRACALLRASGPVLGRAARGSCHHRDRHGRQAENGRNIPVSASKIPVPGGQWAAADLFEQSQTSVATALLWDMRYCGFNPSTSNWRLHSAGASRSFVNDAVTDQFYILPFRERLLPGRSV